ncbi:ammonia-forming cytochrome c nitrite reductase [Parabacteroides sp. AM08-6]|uniref:ammonia-forming cytochrome c nitrite reductase n=1 Tax=Parabacteroides sp. AM08-6 TaxID=2292053 RepID=UPI000F008E9B|nr:ammonia-forming cytochrome c nitrite reductase [Parabacteroides sp. AM08-6]RHJ87617.1 ammonia-forming cytochrome c nitrite reductase [Parabacteroides sp. AM08-6]
MMRLRRLGVIGGIILVGVAVIALFEKYNNAVSFVEDVSEIKKDTSLYADISLRYSDEYKSWKNTTDTTFQSLYNGNQSVDVLESHPEMVILWAGYAFSKSYQTPRGHMYSIRDLRESLRTGAPSGSDDGPQRAACWACKSPDVSRLMETMGEDAFYRKSWAVLGSEIVNPVGCADCHNPENMSLRISRPFFSEAYNRLGKDIHNASEQEMHSLVCAQCHVEYYFEGEQKAVALPWERGLTVEDIEAFYDQSDFSDFTHKLSRTPLLKAQHPDYELAQMGIHAQRGISCAECHMSYIGEKERRFKNHHIQSPLAMIDQTCQVCHRETKETLQNNVYERQEKVMEVRSHLEKELTKAHIEAKFAWERGASAEQMRKSLQLIRQSQWRWDFVTASHGASFHAPLEVLRILSDGLYKAQQARMNITKVLFSLGYNQEVPMPDISTKAKAQKYIGLDMFSENEAKRKFLETVIPLWTEEAKANHRFNEEYEW